MSKQPEWKLLANLGDVNPIDYGGYFVYVDETGVYPPEVEYLESPDDDDAPEGWTVYRFILEPCTYQEGILSDNPYHPMHAVWFADKLSDLASFVEQSELDLINQFVSDNPIDRARAWRIVGDYFGYHELDSYPLTFHNREEIEARYAEKIANEN